MYPRDPTYGIHTDIFCLGLKNVEGIPKRLKHELDSN